MFTALTVELCGALGPSHNLMHNVQCMSCRIRILTRWRWHEEKNLSKCTWLSRVLNHTLELDEGVDRKYTSSKTWEGEGSEGGHVNSNVFIVHAYDQKFSKCKDSSFWRAQIFLEQKSIGGFDAKFYLKILSESNHLKFYVWSYRYFYSSFLFYHEVINTWFYNMKLC